MAAYKVINLDSPIESDYWVDIPVRDPATNKDAVDEQGRILVERHVTRSVKNEELSTIITAVETVNTLKEDYSTFKEDISTKVNSHDSNILTNTNSITTLTDSVNNHDLQINALYTKINAIQGIDIDDFKYVTETDIKNIKENYLPLAGGTLTGSVIINGSEEEVSVGAYNNTQGYLYLYANARSKGLYAQNADRTFNFGVIEVDQSSATFMGNLHGNANRAIGDINGKALTSYIANLEVSGASVTVTNGVGETSNYTVDNVNHATNATNATNAINATNATNANHAKTADSATTISQKVNSSEKTHTNYNTNGTYVPTMNFLSFWNGAFTSRGDSNLTYCAQGTIIGSDNIGSQSVNYAKSAGSVAWANVSGRPSSFTPSRHTHDDRYYTESEIDTKLGNLGAITGEIKWFAFNAVPTGYLVCNGASVSRTTYANLFKAIGTTFGSGDGSTTFTLPNLIDKFAQGSTTIGTYKSAGLPNITGIFNPSCEYANAVTASGAFSSSVKGSQTVTGIFVEKGTPQFSFNASRSSSIYGNSTTVQPPALTLLPCIKY